MKQIMKETRSGKSKLAAIFSLCVVATMVAPYSALAKQGGDKRDRSEYIGIIKTRPAGSLLGRWVIGDRAYTTEPTTEFDQSKGKLTVGTCAKVHIRNGQVHEIDSEPMRNCQ
jgi:hypothetical protein